MTIRARRARPETFAPFGNVVSGPAGTPTSQAAEYKFWSDIADYLIDGRTEIGLCTVYRQKTPVITGMERHLRTPEILIPIDAPFVLPLLLDGREPDETAAFRVNPGEAVVINNGVWHGACLPYKKKQSSYFVIFRLGTPHEDVEKKSLPPLAITAA
ncbi:MAG: ureidoglycolate lyase [Bacteroidota bacterium]